MDEWLHSDMKNTLRVGFSLISQLMLPYRAELMYNLRSHPLVFKQNCVGLLIRSHFITFMFRLRLWRAINLYDVVHLGS